MMIGLVLDKWVQGLVGYSNGTVQKVLRGIQGKAIDTMLTDISI